VTPLAPNPNINPSALPQQATPILSDEMRQATVIAGTATTRPNFITLPGGGIRRQSTQVVFPTPRAGLTSPALNPNTGEVAGLDESGNLYIGEQLYILSPASQFGLDPNLRIKQLAWSKDGRYLAFLVERVGARDNQLSFEQTTADGIWVFDALGKSTRHVFRNCYTRASNSFQLVSGFSWTNDNQTLAVFGNPFGLKLVPQSADVDRNANDAVQYGCNR